MSYIETLDKVQKENIGQIICAMEEKGIVNIYTRAAILSVISKESSFKPKNEISYRNTPNDRIRLIFGAKIRMFNEDELSNLKLNEEQFFNAIYGNRYGNGPEDGFLYRGRGFNQLTFKGNYRKIANDIGIDIVKNPDLVNNIDIASKVVVQYFINNFKSMPAGFQKVYNVKYINGFESLKDAVNCMYHANAGWGKSVNTINADVTGGLKKAILRSTDIYNYANQ